MSEYLLSGKVIEPAPRSILAVNFDTDPISAQVQPWGSETGHSNTIPVIKKTRIVAMPARWLPA